MSVALVVWQPRSGIADTTLSGRHVDLLNVPARCIITPRETLGTSLFFACWLRANLAGCDYSQMKYRLVVQTTNDQGAVSEDELLPEVVSEPGWQCAHAIWPAWIAAEQAAECGWCHAPLVACEFVTCPWCEWLVPTERVLEHWGGGCDD